MSERKIVSFSFDLADDVELKMYNHLVSKGPGRRSRYIRRLIYDDLMGVKNLITTTTHIVEEESSEDFDAMQGFL